MKDNNAERAVNDDIIGETYQLLKDIDSVLGISKAKQREKRIMECITEFRVEMIGRFTEEGSEYITVHISEATNLEFEIERILSEYEW